MAGIAKLQLLIDIKEKLNAGLNTAKQKVDRAVNGIQSKLNSISLNSAKAFGAIQDLIPSLGSSLTSLLNPYAAVAGAIMFIGTTAVKATTMANQWHEQMAEINVTAELSKDKLKGLSDQILEIGGRNVAPLEEVPKAFSKIISAGLSVNDSLKTLEPTLRAAKAGFTEVETVAAAGTSVMMSTGYEAVKVYDILFQTVKEGNAEFKDIAQYLPKVIPLAKNVGYELEQTAGAFAMLTGRLNTETSTTALQGIMRALSSQRVAIGQIDKATGKYVSGFKSIGIDVFDPMTNKIKPILEIVKELDQKMKGLSDKERMTQFDKIGLDQMGSLGLTSLMQDIPALEKSIKATTESAGSLEKAYKDSLTPMESWKEIQNQIKVGMIKLGEYFLPFVSAAGTKILNLIQYWKDLYANSQIFRDVLSAIKVVFNAVYNISTIALMGIINMGKGVWSILSKIVTEIGNWITKITGIKGGFTGLYNTIRPYLIWIKEFLSEIGGLMYDVFTLDFSSAKDKIKNFKIPDLTEIKQRVTVKTEPSGDFSGVPTKDNPTETGGQSGKGDSKTADAGKTIKGNSETKNITINIDSFIKGFTPTHQSINGMSKEELERWMKEMFMRVVRSVETGY
jgi:TP901 family phage tail tape measure protein